MLNVVVSFSIFKIIVNNNEDNDDDKTIVQRGSCNARNRSKLAQNIKKKTKKIVRIRIGIRGMELALVPGM
jgi:hypothetical protein